MATFVVCTQCGRVQEIAGIDQPPDRWQRTSDNLLCPHCTDTNVLDSGSISEVLEEEVIYPSDRAPDDTLDEGFCEVCAGPCQGH